MFLIVAQTNKHLVENVVVTLVCGLRNNSRLLEQVFRDFRAHNQTASKFYIFISSSTRGSFTQGDLLRKVNFLSNFFLFPVSNFNFGNFETFWRAFLKIGPAHCWAQGVQKNGTTFVDTGLVIFVAPNIIDFITRWLIIFPSQISWHYNFYATRKNLFQSCDACKTSLRASFNLINSRILNLILCNMIYFLLNLNIFEN